MYVSYISMVSCVTYHACVMFSKRTPTELVFLLFLYLNSVKTLKYAKYVYALNVKFQVMVFTLINQYYLHQIDTSLKSAYEINYTTNYILDQQRRWTVLMNAKFPV